MPIHAPKILLCLNPKTWLVIIETPKRYILSRNRTNLPILVQIGQLVRSNQKRKKKQGKKTYSGKLSVRPDHPRWRSDMWSCMPGGLREIVINFKFRQNRMNRFRDVGVEICHFLYLRPLWLIITACTAVQLLVLHNSWLHKTTMLVSCFTCLRLSLPCCSSAEDRTHFSQWRNPRNWLHRKRLRSVSQIAAGVMTAVILNSDLCANMPPTDVLVNVSVLSHESQLPDTYWIRSRIFCSCGALTSFVLFGPTFSVQSAVFIELKSGRERERERWRRMWGNVVSRRYVT